MVKDDVWHTPLLTPLLAHQPACWLIVGASVLHAGLMLADLPGWPCPIRYGLGIPCPGCGLSRGMVALLKGDWSSSLTYHAFAPLFLLGLLLVFVVTLLPVRPREQFIVQLEGLERATGIAAIGLIGLIIYWLARLLILGDTFTQLVLG